MDGDDFLRRLLGDFLDVHPAFGRDDERRAGFLAIDQHRKIKLACDVGTVFDVNAVDLFSRLARLFGDERRAEHLLGEGRRFLRRFREADAALFAGGRFLEFALAAPAGVNLRLHDIERSGERFCGGFRVLRVEHDGTLRDGHAKRLQKLLGLIFVNVHRGLRPRKKRAPRLARGEKGRNWRSSPPALQGSKQDRRLTGRLNLGERAAGSHD